MTGSDLVPALFSAASEQFRVAQSRAEICEPLRVYLLGGRDRAQRNAPAARIETQWPGVKVVGCDSPAPGFEKHPADNEAILDRIAASNCQVLVVGFGRRNKNCGSTTIAGESPPPWRYALARRSTFWPAKSSGRPFGCAASGWNGCIAWQANRGDWQSAYLRDAIRFPRLLLGELMRPDLELR